MKKQINIPRKLIIAITFLPMLLFMIVCREKMEPANFNSVYQHVAESVSGSLPDVWVLLLF